MDNYNYTPKTNISPEDMEYRYSGRLIRFGLLLDLMENDGLAIDMGRFDYRGAHFKYSDQRNYNTTRYLDFKWEYISPTWLVRLGTCDTTECTPEDLGKIVFTFDRATIPDRIKDDDVLIMDMVRDYPPELIQEYLKLAIDSNAEQLVAGLMNLKHERELESGEKVDFDPFADFEI